MQLDSLFPSSATARPWPGHSVYANVPAEAWLALAFDEIDYGVVLLDARLQLTWANYTARTELDSTHPLRLLDGRLVAVDADDVEPLQLALLAGLRGVRKLLTVGKGKGKGEGRGVSIALVPLYRGGMVVATMVTIGKRKLCEQLSIESFGRGVGLTSAETRVLNDICKGDTPQVVALRHGVAISTIRTQIQSIRHKTGTSTMEELLRKVGRLPPLLNALRGSCTVREETARPAPLKPPLPMPLPMPAAGPLRQREPARARYAMA